MKKRIFAAIFAFAMIIALSACGGNTAPDSNQFSQPSSAPPSFNPSPDSPPTKLDDVSEKDKNANVFDSVNITHLDDFKQYGFTYEALPEGFEVNYRQYPGVLVSDVAKIYVQSGIFAYEISLFDRNIRDVHISETHSPGMDAGYSKLDVGYGLELPDAQMTYMGFVAKSFYENPSAPFAHLVPDKIADAAAQNDIFIDVKYVNDTWRLLFISLRYSYVFQTYQNGSQSILPNGLQISIDSSDTAKPVSFLINGVDFNNQGYNIIKQSIESSDGTDNAFVFNPDTLEWTFNDEVISGLIELMGALNTPYEK